MAPTPSPSQDPNAPADNSLSNQNCTGDGAFNGNDVPSLDLLPNQNCTGDGAFSGNDVPSLDLLSNQNCTGDGAFNGNDVPSLDLGDNSVDWALLFNGDNSLANQNYTQDWAFTGNDVPSLDLGDNGDISILNQNYTEGWTFNGDNSLSVNDYPCNEVLSLHFTDSNEDSALPFNGDYSGCTAATKFVPHSGGDDNTGEQAPPFDHFYTGGNIISQDAGNNSQYSIEDFTCNNMILRDGGGSNNMMSQDWRMSIPTGFKFEPSDAELVINYLQPESFGVSCCSDGIISRVDVYAYQPHQLSSMAVDFGDGKMYFYTRIKRIGKSKNDRKIKSRPGCHWKATQAPKEIQGRRSGATLAYKTPLAYHEEEDKKTQWLMQEYRLKSHSSSPIEDELVLAVIYYHHRKRRRQDQEWCSPC